MKIDPAAILRKQTYLINFLKNKRLKQCVALNCNVVDYSCATLLKIALLSSSYAENYLFYIGMQALSSLYKLF